MRKWEVRKMVCAQVGRAQKNCAQKIVRKKNCAQVGTNLIFVTYFICEIELCEGLSLFFFVILLVGNATVRRRTTKRT